MDATARAIVGGLFFLFIFLSGLWLTRIGRPLNVAVSTLHKLISLAAGVWLLVTIYQRSQVLPLNGSEWAAVVATGLCFAGTVAAGGVLAGNQARPVAALRAHQIVPVLTALSTAATLYLVLGRL